MCDEMKQWGDSDVRMKQALLLVRFMQYIPLLFDIAASGSVTGGCRLLVLAGGRSSY